MVEPLLEVENLRVEFFTPSGPLCAVDDVSFTIGRGEIVGLAGESGSGKSTIAQAILRILQPPAIITGGAVRFEGEDLLGMSSAELDRVRWSQLALVFQSAMNALSPVMRIGEQIADVVVAHGQGTWAEALERAADMLTLVGIDRDRLRSYPHELSGGMRQRVMIAVALVLKPKLLMMDEPTTALDVVVQKEILAQIRELKDELGFSVLFITHDLPLMLELTDRLAILYGGRLAEMAPTSELIADAQHPYTRGLLASSPALFGPRSELSGIAGSPPNLGSLPSGCRFHPRCGEVIDRCRDESPELLALGTAPRVSPHLAACHLLGAAS